MPERHDRLLRDVEAVGRDVAGGHALRHVQRDHGIDGRGGPATRGFADLRADERADEGEEGDREEHELRHLARRAGRHQTGPCSTEGGERAPAAKESEDDERDERERREEETRELRVRERDPHGVLRKSVAARATSTKRSAAPRARNPRCASW